MWVVEGLGGGGSGQTCIKSLPERRFSTQNLEGHSAKGVKLVLRPTFKKTKMEQRPRSSSGRIEGWRNVMLCVPGAHSCCGPQLLPAHREWKRHRPLLPLMLLPVRAYLLVDLKTALVAGIGSNLYEGFHVRDLNQPERSVKLMRHARGADFLPFCFWFDLFR